MRDRIRVGVIGTGFMGKCHCLAYGATKATFRDGPEPVPTTLCDIEPDGLEAKADAFGFERFTTDWRTVISDLSIDAVSITT